MHCSAAADLAGGTYVEATVASVFAAAPDCPTSLCLDWLPPSRCILQTSQALTVQPQQQQQFGHCAACQPDSCKQAVSRLCVTATAHSALTRNVRTDRSIILRMLSVMCVAILPEGLAGIVRGASPAHERVAMMGHKVRMFVHSLLPACALSMLWNKMQIIWHLNLVQG